MVDFNEYSQLAETGYSSVEPIKPEDEFFHSVYISGKEETAGKFQVRGVEYNLDSINMIITNVKEVLVKMVKSGQRDKLDCFSYKSGQPPWTGISGRVCGQNSAERAANDFCNACRAQIIVTGIYCDASGKPQVGEDGKPVFVFIRGKGMKYSNVSKYLGDMFKKDDLNPIFTPSTEESKKFEKEVVNKMRFVTNITKGEANSQYGVQTVFELAANVQLSDEVVHNVLEITRKTVDKFNEKFDWSKNKQQPTSTGYGDQTPAEGVLSMENNTQETPSGEAATDNKVNPESANTFMSFTDVEF